MATIDNLNFKVIIDDKSFNAKIKEMEKAAKEFNVSMSRLLDVSKASQQWSQKDVENNRKDWQAKVDEARAQEKINQAKIKTEGLQRKINAQIDRATKGYQSQSRILNELKGYALGYLSISGATKLLSSLVRVTGEFELQKTTLAAMLGDLNQAEQVITRIQGLAVESPFQFKELTTYAKQLSAFSVPAQELYDTTKMLADISAGLGEGMDRIVLAYGQVRSAAFLRGQEVRQFTEAGIPILDELAKQFSELEGRAVSTGEVFDKISARLVPFEMVAKVFKDMTAEGGKFYNMQEIQAETLRGKISNLKDAYEVMLNEIGTAHSEKLKGGVDLIRKMMQNYESLGKTLLQTVVTFGIAKTAIEALSASMGVMSAKSVGVVRSLRNIAAFALKNPYTLLAAGITAAGLGIYKAATALESYEKIQQSVVESKEDFNKSVSTENAKLDTLYAKLRVAKEGTEEYAEAKKQIYTQYAGYISELKAEGIAVDNLALVYTNLKNKISEANKTRFLSSATEDIERTYGEGIDRVYKRFELISKNIGNTIERELMAVEKESLWQYILGDEKALDIPEAQGIRAIVKDMGTGGYGYIVNKAKEEAKQISDAYTQGLSEIEKAFNVATKNQQQGNEKLVTGWRKTVQDTLTGMGLNKGTSFGLWAEDTTQSTTYVEDMIKRYKELKEEIQWVSTFDKDQADRLKKNKEAIEKIAKALNIDIAALASTKKGKSKEQIALETQIDTVKKLQDAYEKLSGYLTETQLRDTLSNLFPEAKKEWLESFDFSSVLRKLADDLAKYDSDAATKLKASIGKDVAGSLADAFKEIEAYKKMLDEWMGEDFNLSGKGTSLDISKILRDLNNQYNQIDQKRLKALELLKKAEEGDAESIALVRTILGEEVWNKYLIKGEEVINQLANKEKRSAKEIADEKIRDKSNAYVKEILESNNVDLTDLSEKSYSQLNTLVERIKTIRSDVQVEMGNLLAEMMNGDFTEGQKARLDMLAKVVELLGLKIEDVGVELQKSLFDRMSDGVGIVGSLADELSKLGEAIGSDDIAGFGKEISSIVDIMSKLLPQVQELSEILKAEGVSFTKIMGESKNGKEYIKSIESNKTWDELSDSAKGGIIGVVAGVATAAISKVADIIGQAREEQIRLTEATLAYNDALLEIRRNAHDGLFGTDEMALATENAKILAEAQEDYAKTLNSFENDKSWRREKRFGTLTMKQMSVSDVIGNIADSQGWELYRENGELNIDALISYYDAYADYLTNKQKDVVDALISSYEAQNDAAAQSAEYMKSLFSGVADSIADGMVSAFIESGDAAMDMRSVVSDVASKMASDLIKSLYIMPILTDYAERLDAIASNQNLTADEKTTQALAVFQMAVEEIEGNKDSINALLGELDEYFLHPEEDGTNALGEGIKGITEDQANLLASYLNAIRADVSFSKTLWVKMDANLQRIADMFVSSPTLMEYQAQIAANTYDTAQATQAILSQLNLLIEYSAGDPSLRIYKMN